MSGIAPKWMRQVFADRGIKPPLEAACAAYVQGLDVSERVRLRAQLDRIVNGVESAGELEALLARIGAATPVPREMPATKEAPQISESALVSHAASSKQDQEAKRSQPAQSKERAAPPWWYGAGVHVYGQKAALKIELVLRREDQPDAGQFTVQLEFAEAKGGRTFDWANKIGFQLTRRELPLLGSMLMGYAGEALDLTNHGPEQDKRLELRQQGARLFVKLRKGARVIAIPVEPADVYEWSAIVLTALKKNREDLDSASILEILKRTGAMHAAPSTQRKTI